MTKNRSKDNREPGIGKTVLEDLRRGDFRRTLRRDFQDLKEFYINDERKERLKKMGWFKRWMYITVWLLKSLFLKLTPVRRILLVVCIILLIISNNGDNNFQSNNLHIISGLIFLFILMLELKDKLLARNELEAGRFVQFALMPDKNPRIPGWDTWLFTRPANEVGGDLVDYLQIDKKRFGVTLADVSGKGLGAALFMAKLQATLRALAPDIKSLAELGEKINAIFYRDTLPNSFASMVYIEIEAKSASLRILNAGHMPPVSLKGSTCKELPKGGNALGILSKSTYKEQHIELQKDELLLVYSDGLTDAQNEQGDFFGEQRLFSLLSELKGLPIEDIGKKIVSKIDRFTGDAQQSDDLSLVLLKRMR